jgi:hypothetical protein
MPESLCPYFWKLLFMWVFIIPYSVVVIPVTPITKKDSFSDTYTMFERFWASLLIWSMAFTMICMVAPIPLFFVDKLNRMMGVIAATGLIGWGLLVIITIVKLIVYSAEKARDRRYNIQRQDSIIKEFVKAKYNKDCPKITWE